MSPMIEVHEIPLSDIKLGDLNIRKTGRDIGIDELADSIKEVGLLQPVVLKGEYNRPPYELIIGQRRFLAHQRLNRDTIPATFQKCDDISCKILSLTENMQRVQPNYADKAQAITDLYVHFNKNASEVARRTGISLPTVLEYVKIEQQATDKAKGMLKSREITKLDVKRAITAAKGEPTKVDALLDKLPKLNKYEKDRLVGYALADPAANVDQLVEKAKTPKMERTIIINLTDELDQGLDRAKRTLSIEKDVIVQQAIEKWLKENGFLGDK